MDELGSKSTDTLWADVPIERPADDQLNRAGFAASLAKTILSMRGSESFVFGICGPWGCGKSSILRMVLADLTASESEPKPIVVNFNPWWFSGQNQLLGNFLAQLSAAIGRPDAGEGLKRLAKGLNTFAKVLRPVGWIVPAAKHAADVAESEADAATSLSEQLNEDVHRTRAEIDRELRRLDRRIVIVMDDIDRLRPIEISQLFAIVKAVADFPNTVYVLAFDQAVVGRAIRKKLGLNGAAYLEKIVQIRVDVPPPSPDMLQKMFSSQLEGLIPASEVNDKTSKAFANLFYGGIKTFFKTPRSVKSLTNVLRVLFPAVAGEVNWSDFVALTALQVFAPDVYRTIRDNRDHFTGHNDSYGRDNRDQKNFHELWRDRVPEAERAAVSEIVRRLFPKAGSFLGGHSFGADFASQWQAERRVCSPEHFDCYFQFQLPAGAIGEAEWRRFLDSLSSTDKVDDQIKLWAQEQGRNGRTSRVKELLEKVSLFAEYGATTQQAKGLLACIGRNGERLISLKDEDRSSLLPIDNELRIAWAVQHLLEKIPEGAERDRELEQALSSAGLQTIAKLVELFGRQHGLFGANRDEQKTPQVSRDCVDRLRQLAVNKFQEAARDGSLAANHQALFAARDWQTFDESGAAKEWVTKVCTDDETLVRFLIGAQTSTSSHSMGDHVASIGKSASASFLVHWFDGKVLRQRCQSIVDGNDPWLNDDARAAVQLVVNSLDEDGTPLDPIRRNRTTGSDGTKKPQSSEASEESDDLADDSDGI